MRYSEHKTQIADSIDSLSKTNYEIKRGIKAIRGDIKLRNKSMNDNPRYILSTPDTNRKKKKINPLVKDFDIIKHCNRYCDKSSQKSVKNQDTL